MALFIAGTKHTVQLELSVHKTYWRHLTQIHKHHLIHSVADTFPATQWKTESSRIKFTNSNRHVATPHTTITSATVSLKESYPLGATCSQLPPPALGGVPAVTWALLLSGTRFCPTDPSKLMTTPGPLFTQSVKICYGCLHLNMFLLLFDSLDINSLSGPIK